MKTKPNVMTQAHKAVDADIRPSIERQVAALAKRFGADFKELMRAVDDRDALVALALKLTYDYEAEQRGKGGYWIPSLMPVLLLLTGRFEAAWIINAYGGFRWARKPEIFKQRKCILDVEDVWDHRLFLEYYQARQSEIWWDGFNVQHPKLFLDLDGYLEDSLIKSGLGYGKPYELSPEKRYKAYEDCPNRYIIHETLGINLSKANTLIMADRDADAEECLFRSRHILSSGSGSRAKDSEHFKHGTTISFALDAELRARAESDPARRRWFAWSAIFWWLEYYLREGRMAFAYFTSLRMKCIGIMGEFDLFGDDQTEFLKYFKLLAMQASVKTYQRLLEEPTKIVSPQELGMPTGAWCKEAHDKI